MFPYILIFLLILGFNFIKNENKNYIKLMIILFLFAALRGNGDGDYFNYKEYSLIVQTSADVIKPRIPMEIGFRMISYINNKLNLNSQWVIIVMNFLSLYCMGLFFKYRSKKPVLSVLLFFPYYLQFDMHASRSAVAISFGCMAIHYLLESKKIKYFIFCFLAIAFHSSSAILLLIIFIKNIRLYFFLEIFLIVFCYIIILCFSLDEIIIELLKNIGLIKFATRYLAYTNSQEYGYPFKLYDPRLVLNILTYLLIRIRILKSFRRKKDEIALTNIFILSIMLTILLSEHTIFVTRIISYLSIVTTVLIPNKIYRIGEISLKKNIYKIYLLFFIISYTLFNVTLILKMVPYKFYSW